MTTVQSEVFEAFRTLGIAEEAAMKAAAALGRRDDDVAGLHRDMAVMKWMLGAVLAFQVAIFIKLFLH